MQHFVICSNDYDFIGKPLDERQNTQSYTKVCWNSQYKINTFVTLGVENECVKQCKFIIGPE